ncbi:hypothetical protein HDV64DRAFT_244784 [Trichoderma sp. TUCIM 5745]
MSEWFLIITSRLATSVHVQRLKCVLLLVLLASLGTRGRHALWAFITRSGELGQRASGPVEQRQPGGMRVARRWAAT